MRLILCSAILARTQVSQTCGSVPFNLVISIKEKAMAAERPPRSEPRRLQPPSLGSRSTHFEAQRSRRPSGGKAPTLHFYKCPDRFNKRLWLIHHNDMPGVAHVDGQNILANVFHPFNCFVAYKAAFGASNFKYGALN